MAFQLFTGHKNAISSSFLQINISRLDENLRAKCPPQYLANEERVKEAVARVNNIGPKK